MSYATSTLKGQCIAEFLGTATIIFFGAGCVAAMKVAGTPFGQWEISIVWGLAVAMAVYLTAGISGAHLNPAVSVAMWLFANFDGRKVIPYATAQVAGAFCSAALVYGLYHNLFLDYEQTHQMVRGSVESLDLAGVFSTYPNPHISVGQAFLVELTITAIMMALIMALTDDGNGLPWPDSPTVDWFADRHHRCINGPSDRFCPEPGKRLRPQTVRLGRWLGPYCFHRRP